MYHRIQKGAFRKYVRSKIVNFTPPPFPLYAFVRFWGTPLPQAYVLFSFHPSPSFIKTLFFLWNFFYDIRILTLMIKRSGKIPYITFEILFLEWRESNLYINFRMLGQSLFLFGIWKLIFVYKKNKKPFILFLKSVRTSYANTPLPPCTF